MNAEMITTIIILIAAVFLYSTARVGYAAASFLILGALYATGIVKVENLFANLINSSTLLVIFMFILSGALLKSGASALLGKWISHGVQTEKGAVMRLFLASAAMSSVISNMATATIVATFAVGIASARKEFRLQKLLMGVAVGSILGGMLTIIGVSGNAMVRSFLEEAGVGTVGFWDFGKIGLPLCIAGGLYMYFLGYRLSPGRNTPAASETEDEELQEVKDFKKCALSILVFVGVVVSMILEPVSGIPLHISAFAGCLVLLLGRVITEKEAFTYVNWPSTVMFSTLLTLGGAIADSGVAQLMADGLVYFGGGVDTTAILIVLFVLIIILTQFMSNGATTAIFYPVGLVLAKAVSASPVAVLMMICVAASCSFATPMATPLNAYLMTIADYKFSDFVKVGLPLMLISALVAVPLCPLIWQP